MSLARALRLTTFLLIAAALLFAAKRGIDYLRTAESTDVPTMRVQTQAFERSIPAEGYLKAEKATPITAPVGVPPLKIAWLKENGSNVKEGEVVVRFDEDEFQRSLSDGRTDREVAEVKLASEQATTESAANTRDRTVELAKLNLEVAKARAEEEDDEIFSANEILNSRIDGKLSEARVQHAQRATSIDRKISRSKMRLLELERKAAELSIGRAQQGLTKMEVIAPHAGIFVYEDSDLKAGDTVYPGRPIASLPLVETMEAEVFVLEADAMGLAPGKKASLVLEAHRDQHYAATIKSVDSLAKPRQREVPIQYFSVILSLETTDPEIMKPGQRVEARLELESADAITLPRQCVFEVNGEMVAFRKQGSAFEAVKLELGTGTPGLVVVESGLSAGDIIATRDPFGKAGAKDDESAVEPEAEGATP